MRLTVNCQLCGKILTIVEKDNFSDEDIAMYKQSCACDNLQGDGITLDGQTDIQVTKTQA